MLDLERRLGNLVPAAPLPGWIDRAIEIRGGVSRSDAKNALENEKAGRRGWLKFAPVGIAAVVMITGALLATRVERSSTGSGGLGSGDDSTLAATSGQLVPVSMENALRETELAEVVAVEGYGLMRPVMLHFETAQCWIDPETETSVQVIRPWQELVFYPVETY